MQIDKSEYGSYYGRYIELVNGIPLENLWKSGAKDVITLIDSLTDDEALIRYEEDKWSLKEVIGHVLDTERIFCYRALAVARGEESIKGYDHNIYLDNADFDRVTLNSLKEQYNSTREYSMSLFNSFSDKDLVRTGTVNDAVFSVRAMAYVIGGHEQHHLHVIAERYLPIITQDAP
jgi:hypothetical protein